MAGNRRTFLKTAGFTAAALAAAPLGAAIPAGPHVRGGQVRPQARRRLSGPHLEYPNLVLTVPESAAQPWIGSADDFIIQGNNGQGKERSGTLDFLAQNVATVLGTLTFSNLGIFKCSPEKSEASSDAIRRVKVELYCEEMRFVMPA